MKRTNLFIKSLMLVTFSLGNLQANAIPVEVDLSVGYVDPTNNEENQQKTPIPIPCVSIDGSELYFETPCDGCVLRIVDENDHVCYSVVIPTGATSLMLPSYLQGNYEIQIVSGIYYFYGYIEL